MLISTLDNQFPVGWHYHSIVEWIFSVNITQGFRSPLLQHVFLRLDYKINKKNSIPHYRQTLDIRFLAYWKNTSVHMDHKVWEFRKSMDDRFFIGSIDKRKI